MGLNKKVIESYTLPKATNDPLLEMNLNLDKVVKTYLRRYDKLQNVQHRRCHKNSHDFFRDFSETGCNF